MVNSKLKILLLTYLRGIPNLDFGGPNHVIYDFVKHSISEFTFDFMSHGAEIKDLKLSKLTSNENYFLGVKKYTEGLYYKNKFFHSIVSNDLYKLFHFFLHDNYFNKRIPKAKYDIIHAHDSVGLAFTNDFTNSKKIMSIHSVDLLSEELTSQIKVKAVKSYVYGRLRKLEQKAHDMADIITFPSESLMKKYINDQKKDVHKKVKVIYNGVDLERIEKIPPKNLSSFISNSTEKFQLIILSVASHGKIKRLDVALLVIKELVFKHKKNVLFLNVGVGEQTRYLKKLTNNYGIENNVQFLGNVKNEDVIGLMKSCNLLLHLSERVVFDLVILEAMASGLCIVASNEGGNREIIKNDFDGCLLDSLDPSLIATKILSLDKERITCNARMTIQNYSTKKMAADYSRLYEELI